MPKFQIEFFVQHARELSPQLNFAGTTLHPFEALSPDTIRRLEEELDPVTPASLQVNGSVYTIGVVVEAANEAAAMQKALSQASQSIEPYSLIAPETSEINFSRFRPELLPFGTSDHPS